MDMGSSWFPGRRLGGLLGLALLAVLAAGCPGRSPAVTVSGKTAYGDLAVEEAQIVALGRGASDWAPVASTRSGYHGSWVLRLPPGTYRLEARASLPAAGGATLQLFGALDGLVLEGPSGRVDRVVLRLEPAAGPLP